ncbi:MULTISPECIES: type II secretion system minor pseudopilin GspK [Pseudomonas]|jgi:general secretion pathway protein K|nr:MULTISPECIES: type II secretion system minor pseudopilin GspK [Pseudomonas]CRM88158.1 Type II secretory pathway, component PulK [Pseudomonas sp. 22 E 5]MCX9152913.1 type II secretion system minor pseudopilin GspK [Pseudomonas sp. TB1-B1]QXH69717.1 type II secretion system minor pseudopilin GspK [Pseudomonas asgharzadehiana]CRM45022.1 Type II secretory pathway, component PulK [Pseudomonas sp. 31 E 5]CRM58172.1 Type II secretory pathway, component PulK [Pseudomonas sp. 31 E 6]
MKRYSPAAAKQRGMAIISALLIAAVVAVLAGAMLTRQSVFTRSLEAEQSRIQGQWLLQGSLERTRHMLWEARQKDVLTRLDQPWARAQGGAFTGRVEDEQGKFNLRNLVNRRQVDAEQLQSFERLCRLIGVDPAVSRRVSQRVIASYDQLDQPAGYPMLRSLHDLSGIDGLDPALLQRMQAYISVLPDITWVNGNTARAEVLSAVVPSLNLSQAQALVAERDAGHWFINRGDFVNRLHLPQVAVDAVQVGITSEWFRLQGQARQDQRRVTLDALLHRPENQRPQVIWARVGV